MTTTISANQELWEKGDFTRIAAAMREAGESLAATFGLRPGMKVLDVGCGDGTTALPMAKHGAEVFGVDIARNLVAAGNERAAAAGLTNLRFQHGDATDLQDLEDETFDLTVSIFGAMFAPKPLDVARNLVRVTKRGGRVVMGNWIPNDPTIIAQILRICSSYAPPPPAGFVSPMLWGVETEVVERFVAAGVPAANVAFARDTFTFRANLSAADYLGLFRRYYGPTMNAYAAADKAGRADAMHQELLDLFDRENRSGDPGRVEIPATFLRVTVTR